MSRRSGPLKSRRSGMRGAVGTRGDNKKKAMKTVVPRIHSGEDADAKFYMFTYKVGDGPRRPVAIRKGVYNYGALKCPKLFNRVGGCPRGNKCRFAHNSLEIMYHPLVYKTRPCNNLSSCEQGASCAWAHSESDMRRLSSILGRGWQSLDAISSEERRTMRVKKEEKEGKRNIRVSLRQKKPTGEPKKADGVRKATGSSEYSMSVASRMSVTPSRSRTPVTSVAMSAMSESEPPASMEDEKEEENCSDVEPIEICKGSEESKVNEFEAWYRSTFDCDLVDCAYYLGRFQSTNLDDLNLLWGLFELGESSDQSGQKSKKLSCLRPSTLVDLLTNEIGMVDEISRNCFVRRLCEYKSPVDVSEWLDRVVGLPQYVNLFSYLGADARASDLSYLGFDEDDLAEMGISLAGHRAKILYYLNKVQ